MSEGESCIEKNHKDFMSVSLSSTENLFRETPSHKGS